MWGLNERGWVWGLDEREWVRGGEMGVGVG